MKREKRDDAYLWDMLDAAREARELISGLSYDDLMSRKVVRLALERVLVGAYEKKHLTFPVEVYGEGRIGEFDEAETDVEKILPRRKKTAR